MKSRPAASARICSTGSTWFACACRPCPDDAKISRRWRTTAWRAWPRNMASRSAVSPPRRWSRCLAPPGPAMRASCSTWWSGASPYALPAWSRRPQWPSLATCPDPAPSLEQARRRFERDHLVGLLRAAEGNVSRAARLAGRNRTEFYRLLQRHPPTPDPFKNSVAVANGRQSRSPLYSRYRPRFARPVSPGGDGLTVSGRGAVRNAMKIKMKNGWRDPGSRATGRSVRFSANDGSAS